MEEFPGNSHNKETEEPKVPQQKKVTRIIAGEAVRRKKPLGSRFAATFFGESAKNAASVVFFEVVIPAMKDLVHDTLNTALERMLFGDRTGHQSRRPHSRSRPGTHTSYDRYSASTGNPWDPNRRSQPTRGADYRARARKDVDEIVLPSRREAIDVQTELNNLIMQFESASVADLCELVGIRADFTDNHWGWEEPIQTNPIRVRNGGYVLDLPDPISLK